MRPSVRLGALIALLGAALLGGGARAQFRPRPVADLEGIVGLELLLRRLATTGTLLMATAHPDDENNGLLARLTWGEGIRTVLATATRGDGGQNEIGPELFDALAVLRTEELAAAHRFDGAEQYFTRAVDFGYSFSVEETFAKWGRDEILADYVRLIRTIRPDVIVALRPDGEGGGQHHQASARLALDAFRAAADPQRFPDQLREGLRPWRAQKFFFAASFGGPREAVPPGARVVTVALDRYDPLLGRTYAEIGSEARSMHKCQGMPQLLLLPGQAGGFGTIARYYAVEDAVGPAADRAAPAPSEGAERATAATPRRAVPLFEGLDVSLPGLGRLVPGTPPPALVSALHAIAARVDEARVGLARAGLDGAAPALVAGLAAVRDLGRRLETLPGLDEEARFEIGRRLDEKQREFERAVLLAHGLRFDALADDGVVTAGQEVKVTVVAANSGRAPVEVAGVALEGFEATSPASGGLPRSLDPGGAISCTLAARVPASAPMTTSYFRRLPDAARYAFDPDVPFGLPFRPTPFRVRLDLRVPGSEAPVPIVVDRAVEHRYEDPVAGEKRMELHVVPRFAVDVHPAIVIFPIARAASRGPRARADAGGPGAREIRVTVTHGARGAGSGEVALEVPPRWRVAPSSAPVHFVREDEARTVRFVVTPPEGVADGEYRLGAVVRAGDGRYDRGYQVIEYPHIRRRHLAVPAETRAKVFDLAVAPQVQVGYVMGVGDEVPRALEQIGARVVLLGPEDLAWGDLARFDAIVVGIRAYERRADLRAHNDRLLRYVEQGGTLIVQYQRPDWNEGQYGPYPVRIGRERVTDEQAPVTVLVPEHPLFARPNRLGADTWQNWVQERGLYFLDAEGRDPRYVDLVSLEDPFESNRGVKTGALVEARYGKGRWIYVALGLWRQLPAGTTGAYRLLANLVSLGRTGS
jgi:LmbE family N-acetylglucosaminyl deacetylase